MSDDGSGGKATVTDFHIEAADAVKPSGSSIGVFVRDTVPLWLYRCEVIPRGTRPTGSTGLPPTRTTCPHRTVCLETLALPRARQRSAKGGASPESLCKVGGPSKGGVGGDASPMLAADGDAGEPATGNPDDGAGGLGEGSAPMCTDGKTGANGAVGDHGKGGLGFTKNHGRLTMDGYVGEPGQDGKPAAPGQGGGGGGATFGSAAVCGAATPGGSAEVRGAREAVEERGAEVGSPEAPASPSLFGTSWLHFRARS